MEAVRAGFPMDWLADAAAPASDVELALLLVNSHDLLEEQPDRLVDLTWLTRAFTAAGHGDCAAELSPARPPPPPPPARLPAPGLRVGRRRGDRGSAQPPPGEGAGRPVAGRRGPATHDPRSRSGSACAESPRWRRGCRPPWRRTSPSTGPHASACATATPAAASSSTARGPAPASTAAPTATTGTPPAPTVAASAARRPGGPGNPAPRPAGRCRPRGCRGGPTAVAHRRVPTRRPARPQGR